MKEKIFAVPQYTTAEEIKEVRKQLGLKQKAFAGLVNASVPTVERWERSSDPIRGPIVTLLDMLRKNKSYVEAISLPPRKTPLRFFYMYRQRLCTLIDVNELKQEVYIKNYTDEIMYRAFGVNEKPSYKDYQEFLESRCFPESRDKMKLILRDMNLPFYDPFLIIQKTEGRMAEDDFWLRIEQ
ncbi:MAG: transcriptional regulator [Lachnospiraceae bacterium]|nr:transcriptional regulator [Lachnospiraceae bacterium]